MLGTISSGLEFCFDFLNFNTFPFHHERELLVIFTKYPQPGKCKTRLIPLLGHDGAARVHEEMTHHIVSIARRWKLNSQTKKTMRYVAICYDIQNDIALDITKLGIDQLHDMNRHQKQQNELKMRNWLGNDMKYLAQCQGDLTQRLTRMWRLYRRNFSKIITIDTPGITVDILNQAFDMLSSVDVVLGPAIDGGYYLIGMRKFHHEVVTGINGNKIAWSTSQVLSQTVDICQQLHIPYSCDLPPLSDVDYPADFPVWLQQKFCQDTVMNKITVIIPVLNEEQNIIRTLECATQHTSASVVQVIVVDGGSTDNTVSLVKSFKEGMDTAHENMLQFYQNIANKIGCTGSLNWTHGKITLEVLSSPKGRSIQQNAGAEHAEGSVLLFLHGDTTLPLGYADYVLSTLVPGNLNNPVVAGAFRFEIEDSTHSLFSFGKKLVEIFTNLRAKYLQFPYGDQSLFMLSKTFTRLGGFPSIPLMEDFELVSKLRREGTVAIVPIEAPTSGLIFQFLIYNGRSSMEKAGPCEEHIAEPIDHIIILLGCITSEISELVLWVRLQYKTIIQVQGILQ